MSEKIELSFATPLVILHQQARQPQVAVITLTMGEFVFKGVSLFMPGQGTGQAVSQKSSATMPVGTLGTVSVEWHDASGGPVKVDGPTTWSSTDDSVVEVTVATGNPNIANLYAPGPIGTASIHANADADMGQGVQKVTAVIDITTISGQAVGGEIKFTQGPQGPPSSGGPQGSKPTVRGSR
jgi:hypothetical protein